MSTINFPTSPSTGQSFIAPNGFNYVWDGSSWSTSAEGNFLYRTIYTRGYVTGGYKSSSPWTNTNRVVFATDVTTNLGDIHTNSASYCGGGHSDTHHYIYNASNVWSGNSTIVGAMDMTTETALALDTAQYMTAGRDDCEAMMNSSLTKGYITGGGNSTTDRHDFSTGVMLTVGSTCPAGGGGTDGGWTSIYGEFYGWVNANDVSARFSWSNESWVNGGWTLAGTSIGQPKGLSSKHGHGYASIGSYNGSINLYKYADTTETTSSSATITRPEACGEENMVIGQDWGYSMGAYNGVQNNNTQKVNYLTDTAVAMGSDTQPKGHDGSSSGCTGTGSSLLNG